jgi:hypothetical protein
LLFQSEYYSPHSKKIKKTWRKTTVSKKQCNFAGGKICSVNDEQGINLLII